MASSSSSAATPPYPSAARISDSQCYEQYTASLKCLEKYHSDKSKCQKQFDNYKECKKKEREARLERNKTRGVEDGSMDDMKGRTNTKERGKVSAATFQRVHAAASAMIIWLFAKAKEIKLMSEGYVWPPAWERIHALLKIFNKLERPQALILCKAINQMYTTSGISKQ